MLDAVVAALPTAMTRYDMAGRRTGLIIVDEVNGFATVGAGNLAPPTPNAQVARMIVETDGPARRSKLLIG